MQPVDYTHYDDYDDDDDAYVDGYDDDGDADEDTDDADDDTGAVDTGDVDPAADTVDTVGTDLAEAATTVLPVIHAGTPPPARMVGIPVQRAPVHNRNVPPRAMTPRHIPVVGTAPPEPGSTRVRVVLSERKGGARPVRHDQGGPGGHRGRRSAAPQPHPLAAHGDAAVRRCSPCFVLGTLPAVLTLLPEVGRFHLLGVRVPWLLLGLLMYPFLVGVAWRYTRVADRVEQNFADHVQD